jgi:acetyltransferase EpsM
VRLLVIGSGGHAKVVIDAAVASGWEIAGVVGVEGAPADVLGHPITPEGVPVDSDAFIVAVGRNRERARIFDEYRAKGMRPAVIVHPSALLAGGVTVGEGAFVAPGVIVNVGSRIGANTILNTGCVVDHDCFVGDHCHVGPLAGLCGETRIGDGVLMGAGSHTIPGINLGEWTVVGAGAAVVEDLPAHVVAIGVPARAVKDTEE